MSSPAPADDPETRDEFALGCYLDGVLRDEERAALESRLREDGQLRDRLEQMRRLRSTVVRALSGDGAMKTLDAGFANRVLDAAVLRARAEGVPDDHPLVLLSEQPAVRTAKANRSRIAWPAVVAAVAASIAAIWLALRSPDSPSRQSMVADGGNGTPGIADAAVGPELPLIEPPAIGPSATSDTTPDLASLAVDGETFTQPVAGEPESAGSDGDRPDQPSRNAMASSDPIDRSAAEPVDRGAAEWIDSAADATLDAMASASEQVNLKLDLERRPILVIEVRLTDLGRATDPIGIAMRSVGIDEENRRELSIEIAEAAVEATDSSEAMSSLLFLRAPGKRFDRLFDALTNDSRHVAAVGLSLAMSAPVGRASQGLPVDREFADQLESLDYAPMSSDGVRAMGTAISQGDSVMSQVLVVVR